MSGRRVLVTGGAGFIGSHVVDRLLDRGDRVLCIDAFDDFYAVDEKRTNVSAHLQHPAYALLERDIRDDAEMIAAFSEFQPECVLHLAARAGVRPSLKLPQLYASVNVAGTLSILEAARATNVPRVVNASSSSVYGVTTKVPFEEDDPTSSPASPYAATKVGAEALCHAYAHTHGMSICSLRLFTVYGPRQRPDLAIRKFAEALLSSAPLTLFGDGEASRDYTHVSDVVDAFLAAADADISGHRVFNVGSSRPVTLTALVAALEAAVGSSATINWGPPQPGDVPLTYADNGRARDQLGWTPATSLEDGLRDMVAWLRAGP